jgi:diguanylate cyclase (GGDEF)-like protein
VKRPRYLFARARRAVASLLPAIAVGGAGALIAAGAFRDVARPGAGLAPLAAAIALGALLIGRLASYVASAARLRSLGGPEAAGGRELQADVEMGAVLLAATYATLQATGGVASPLYPLVYALIAFLVAFHRLAVGMPLVGLSLVFEAALFRAGGLLGEGGRTLLAVHAGFILFFALIHLLFLRAELYRQRREHRAAVAAEIARMREEARDFRLISSQLGADSRVRTRAEEQEKLAQGAVETIHQALFYNLELLKKSLDLHTCVLLWIDEAGERMRIKELCTDSESIHEGSLPIDAGALGTVVKTRAPLELGAPKPGHLPYYAGGGAEPVGAFLAVPVLEGAHLRGVLCADRKVTSPSGARPFEPRDEVLLAGAARQILRAIQSERVFAAVERGKYEHERFYRASELLNRALTPDQVFATAFQAAREICDFDFAAITLYDRGSKRHTIAAVTGESGPDVSGLEGQSYSDNAGLAAMVVKNKHYLPAGGELRGKETPIYTKKIKLRGMESLLVLPLISADEAIGSFTLAAKRRGVFVKDKREMLGVIANQVAVSTKNAEMYRAMENLATTDGLTGLVNHRTFQERFADLLSRAERHGQRVAFLLTDVDHFKKVNDTYGHPTGDVVLKGVAAVCRNEVRKIDVAARYGGEEFAIVLDGTDLAGARLLAERIRTEVEKQQFSSEKGPFQCTLSLGIACYPDDGRDGKALIAHADQALYHAKHTGRNRAVAWPDVGAARPAIRAVK